MLKSFLPKLILGAVLFIHLKRLLPQEAYDREALTLSSLNIKSRLILSIVKVLNRLTNTFPKFALPALVFILTLGSFLVLPNALSQVQAQETAQFALPHTGYMSTFFSSYHPGIDLATDLGTAVHPINSGSVAEVYYDKFAYGHHVIVTHAQGYKSLYGHLDKIFVKKGQAVDLTTVLGQVGLTGHTSGPHTHLEITRDGQYINPAVVLPKILQMPVISLTLSVGGPLPKPKTDAKLSNSLKPDFD